MKHIFLGIDQTGAVTKQGHARPLESVLIEPRPAMGRKNRLNRLSGPLYYARYLSLKRLTQEDCQTQSGHAACDMTLVVDCVFGLPDMLYLPSETFYQVLLTTKDIPGYGRTVAADYFLHLLKSRWKNSISTQPFPLRTVEALLKTNSIFQTHPFQKNIQTGSFRIWKDLAQGNKWFCLKPLETESKEQALIFEGYPTLMWKQLLKSPTRKPNQLKPLLAAFFPNLKVDPLLKKKLANPNVADAFLLALAGLKLSQRFTYPQTLKKKLTTEGWILGADIL